MPTYTNLPGTAAMIARRSWSNFAARSRHTWPRELSDRGDAYIDRDRAASAEQRAVLRVLEALDDNHAPLGVPEQLILGETACAVST